MSFYLCFKAIPFSQDACKFKAHGKRKKLLPIDFDNALRMRNMEVSPNTSLLSTMPAIFILPFICTSITRVALGDTDVAIEPHNPPFADDGPAVFQPLYGVQSLEHVPFRFTSGGGRELSFQDDRDVELSELVSAQMPKAPLDTTIRGQSLAAAVRWSRERGLDRWGGVRLTGSDLLLQCNYCSILFFFLPSHVRCLGSAFSLGLFPSPFSAQV